MDIDKSENSNYTTQIYRPVYIFTICHCQGTFAYYIDPLNFRLNQVHRFASENNLPDVQAGRRVQLVVSGKLTYFVQGCGLLSPRTTKLWRGYRVCPVRMYVSTYVRTFVRMFTRSSDLIYYPISI